MFQPKGRLTPEERARCEQERQRRRQESYKRRGPAMWEIEGPRDVEDSRPYQLRTGGWLGEGCRWVSAGVRSDGGNTFFWSHD